MPAAGSGKANGGNVAVGTQDCGSSFIADNISSKHSGFLDEHGMVGAACTHDFPACGLFIDMRTPESFRYFLALVHWLAEVRPDVADIYIDVGCRLRPTLERFIAMLPDDERTRVLANVRLVVDWLHMEDHGELCRITNGGKFLELAARRIGISAEHCWSFTKVCARSTMRLPASC